MKVSLRRPYVPEPPTTPAASGPSARNKRLRPTSLPASGDATYAAGEKAGKRAALQELAGAPQLPRELLKEIHDHPSSRTGVTRALEGPLAAVAAAHPRAQGAMNELFFRLRRLIEWAEPNHPPWAEIFTSGKKADSPSNYTKAGDVDPSRAEEVMTAGNLREKMNLLGDGQRYILPLLHKLAVLAYADPNFARTLGAKMAVDVGTLLRRFTKTRDRKPMYMLYPLSYEASAQQEEMRRRVQKSPSKKENRNGQFFANRRSDGQVTPPWSERELSHARAGLEREHSVRLPIGKEWRDADENLVFKLLHLDGTTIFRAVDHHRWHQAARQAGMATKVSISGTAYRLFFVNQLLNPGKDQAQDFILALLGHLVPFHHTYHEVMAAVAERGWSYRPTPGDMIHRAERLLESHPPADSAASQQRLNVLARAIVEAKQAL